jgi:hypothetical protein
VVEVRPGAGKGEGNEEWGREGRGMGYVFVYLVVALQMPGVLALPGVLGGQNLHCLSSGRSASVKRKKGFFVAVMSFYLFSFRANLDVQIGNLFAFGYKFTHLQIELFLLFKLKLLLLNTFHYKSVGNFGDWNHVITFLSINFCLQ